MDDRNFQNDINDALDTENTNVGNTAFTDKK